MIQVIKRDGSKAKFEKDKIVIAIEKAMKSASGVYVENQAMDIANEIESEALGEDDISIYN